jgi:choline kinase
MNVIILAAGTGKRLRSVTNLPKCMLDIEGSSLLHRYLDSLHALAPDNTQIFIVVGYKSQAVLDHVQGHPLGEKVEFIEHREYEAGSILSIWAARKALEGDVLLMDGDVYFRPDLLALLLGSSHRSVLLVDTASVNTGEEIMVGITDNTVVAVGRGMTGEFEAYGEWVGFLRLDGNGSHAFREELAKHIGKGRRDIGYEDALIDVTRAVHVGCELTDGIPWIEIDFPEDLARARALALATDDYDEQQ